MKKYMVIFALAFLLFNNHKSYAQYFWAVDEEWDEPTLIKYKYSSLLPIDISISHSDLTSGGELTANFINIDLGLGFPSSKSWKPFLPSPGSNMATPPDASGLVAFKLGFGWTHYFNHCYGFYTDLSWVPIMDTKANSSNGGTGDMGGMGGPQQSQDGLIANYFPLEGGINVNVFRSFILSSGVSYYWKEKLMWTYGIGVCF